MFKSLVATIATTVITATVLSISVVPSARAEGSHEHSENVCATQNAEVCAHLGLHSVLKSTEAGRFIAHFFTPENTAVSNLKVVLWMPDMGHGTSPVTIREIGPNRYEVSEAWFLMPGHWLVKMSFDFAGASHQIDIPLDIKE